jgi:hypothetical protein
MKLWKFLIFLDDGNTIMRFPRKLSRLEVERMLMILAGGSQLL